MLAYDIRDDYEIIEGVKFMSPSPSMRHTSVVLNLATDINIYLRNKKCGVVFHDRIDVHFPEEKNTFCPDLTIIRSDNPDIGHNKMDGAFYGVPDMVAEIFSRSTMKRDVGIKKDVYERNGVKEYWMIDPWSETIQVYILREGKYELDEVYSNYTEKELTELTDEERAEVKMEVPVAVLDGFKIKVRNIFGWYFE